MQRFEIPGSLGVVCLEGCAAESMVELGQHGEVPEICPRGASCQHSNAGGRVDCGNIVPVVTKLQA